jgi:predicted esterase
LATTTIDLPAENATLEYLDPQSDQWVIATVRNVDRLLSLVSLSLETGNPGADTVLIVLDEHTTCLRPRRRKPSPKKLPEPLHDFTFTNSPDGCDSNLLILLHGLGDSHKPFSKLGQTMAIPQTACLAISAPVALPFDNSFSWFPAFQDDGEVIPPSETYLGDTRRIEGLVETRRLLKKVIAAMVTLGFKHECIFLLGFSQGGTACLDFIAHTDKALGGACIIAANFLPELLLDEASKAAEGTPVIMLHGEKDDVVPLVQARETLTTYKKLRPTASAKLIVIPGKGHSMIGSTDEMQALMTFLAERLYLRNLQLEDRADVVLCA